MQLQTRASQQSILKRCKIQIDSIFEMTLFAEGGNNLIFFVVFKICLENSDPYLTAKMQYNVCKITELQQLLKSVIFTVTLTWFGNLKWWVGISFRTVWITLLVLGLGLTIWQCYMQALKFIEKPIATNIDVVYRQNLTFPVVAICNGNQYRYKSVKLLQKRLQKNCKIVKL